MSGIGLGDYEIGRVVWETGDLDSRDYTHSIAYFDCENKGKRDCVAVGTGDDIINAFYPNGTGISPGNWGEEALYEIYEIETFDADNDGYYNEIVSVESVIIIHVPLLGD